MNVVLRREILAIIHNVAYNGTLPEVATRLIMEAIVHSQDSPDDDWRFDTEVNLINDAKRVMLEAFKNDPKFKDAYTVLVSRLLRDEIRTDSIAIKILDKIFGA